MNSGCYLDNVCTNHYFYADDMCLLAPSACGLQKLIDQCAKYGNDHDIVYNPLKSKCVVFQPRSYRLTIPSVRLYGEDMQYVDNIKYLGVILSNNLKDDLDISRQLRCLYVSANIILRRFASCSKQVKLLLIESYCCNFYCSLRSVVE